MDILFVFFIFDVDFLVEDLVTVVSYAAVPLLPRLLSSTTAFKIIQYLLSKLHIIFLSPLGHLFGVAPLLKADNVEVPPLLLDDAVDTHALQSIDGALLLFDPRKMLMAKSDTIYRIPANLPLPILNSSMLFYLFCVSSLYK